MAELYGRARDKKRRVVFLYTRRSSALFTFLKVLLLTVFSPIWLPLYILTHLGYWSEVAMDKLEPLLEWVLVKIVPRQL